MPREKINFDKKKLFQLFDKSEASIVEKGVLVDLSRFLFNAEHYHLLFDPSSNTIFTRDILIDYLSKHVALPENIIDGMISKGILDINNQDQVYVPLLFHQKIASNNKKRSWSPKPVVAQIEKVEKKPEAVQVVMPIGDTDPVQDLKFHMLSAQNQSKKVKDDAKEILDYLNKKTNREKGFGPTEGNLRPIIARLREGHKVEECKQMIDFKWHQWMNTGKEAYMRPQTLFIPKNFETYLNEALNYYKQRSSDKKHELNAYIDQWFKRVAKIPIQMSYEECVKITAQCPDKEAIKKCLLSMENDPKLLDYNNSVFLTLKTKLDRMQGKHHGFGKGPAKSAAK